jgi:hypothetical protein
MEQIVIIKRRKQSMIKVTAFDGRPYSGSQYVRFDEGEVAPAATPRRGSLLYKLMKLEKAFMMGRVIIAIFAASGNLAAPFAGGVA